MWILDCRQGQSPGWTDAFEFVGPIQNPQSTILNALKAVPSLTDNSFDREAPHHWRTALGIGGRLLVTGSTAAPSPASTGNRSSPVTLARGGTPRTLPLTRGVVPSPRRPRAGAPAARASIVVRGASLPTSRRAPRGLIRAGAAGRRHP